MLTPIAPLFLLLVPQSDGAAQRRAEVERLLTPSPWVQGHEFTLEERMAALNVPGVSLAVIHEGRIDWAAGYGVRDSKSGAPVTTETLFQAASISKPVSAMAAHRLAQEGKLDLDAPINSILSSWKLPDDGFEGDVTPRRIMSHTGGLGVHGFGGYASFDELPTTLQVLDGTGPANSAAVRRIDPLGRGTRYSGGGSTILQQALCDLSGKDFASLLNEEVLAPLGMTRSTFLQPLPTSEWPNHATGHGPGGRPIAGNFRTHPEQFAAGLWTTASDLARFALELQAALNFDAGEVLSAEAAAGMLQVERFPMALGLMIQEHDDERWFGHGGSNMGFKNDFRASFEGGRGVFILTNGDQGSVLAGEILRAVARVYDWPEVVEAGMSAAELKGEELDAFVGRYGSEPDQVAYITREGEQLTYRQGFLRPQRLAPLGKDRFLVLGSRQQLSFKRTGERASSLRTNGMSHAPRLEEFEHWPIDDLLAGDVGAALAFYREVYEADGGDPMISAERLMALATGLWNDQRTEAALAIAELCSELYAELPDAWYLVAELSYSLHKPEAAKRAYQRCLEALPSSDQGWLYRLSHSMLRGLGD